MPFTPEQLNDLRERLSPAGEEFPNALIAIVFETVKALNTLRALHGLPAFTKTQVVNAIRSTAQNLEGEDD